MPSSPRIVWVLVVALVVALSSAAGAAGAYDEADAALTARVREDGLPGGVLLVGRDGGLVHRFEAGSTTPRTVMPIASASKWLTAATLMTFVDEGRLSLDDPVSEHLPGFDGGKEDVTVRQLLSHTTGLPSAGCEGDPTTTLRRCVASIAASADPSTVPGTAFRYSGVGFAVAGRIIERLNGSAFQEAFAERIGRPLGMTHTRFDGTRKPHSRNPSPAASATSTVDDYTRFLQMLASGGTVDGRGCSRRRPSPRSNATRWPGATRAATARCRSPGSPPTASACGATRSHPTTASRW